MRTFEELRDAVSKATRSNDAASLMECADELDALATSEAEAAAHNARGVASYFRGNYPAALEHYHRALATFEVTGNNRGLANVTSNIGNAQQITGNYPAALEHYHRALATYDELGDLSGVASVTSSIGMVLERTGNYPAALEHFHRALLIHEELGDSRSVAGDTNNIGNMHTGTGNYPAALEHFHRALAVNEELGNRSWVAINTHNIGIVHYLTGNYPAALEHYHRTLAIDEELGNRSGVARVTGSIGTVHFKTGNYPAALEHYHRALALQEELGNRRGVAIATSNIGIVHNSTGNYPAALEHFHRALAMHEMLGESRSVAQVTVNIITTMIDSGKHAEAEALLQTMDALQIDDPIFFVQREQGRASLQEHHGNIDEARATLRAALLIAQEHTLGPKQAEVHKSLRDLCQKTNDLAGYIEHNNEFTRITEEINGKDTATKLAIQEKQREIDAERKEIDKQLAVLHSTLPKHIADRVAKGEVVNDHYANASVLFLDIVGFTSISDRIPSGHVVHLLEQIFTTLDAVCERYGVVKIKTIGDSYMAVSFDSVTNAATCAHDMISSLDALEITMPPSLGDTSWTKDVGDIRVRIGMHCGPVTAGVIGTARMQYDVWGDTVNVASRMESSGEPGRIHVSEAFAHALDSGLRRGDDGGVPPSPDLPVSLSLMSRGTLDIKGKGPMATYWLESTST